MKSQYLALVIRAEREKQNLTQEHLAELAELSARTIQRLESEGTHSQETMMAVAEAFKMDCKELLRMARELADKGSQPRERFEVFREQLEVKMQSAEDAQALALQAVDRLCRYWEEYTRGWSVNDNGRRKLLEWLRTYSFEEIAHGMDGATHYLMTDGEGGITAASWEKAFAMIRGVCRTERASKDDPDLRDLYYIRGILRNKCAECFNNARTLDGLRIARRGGISLDQLKDIARRTLHWADFAQVVNQAIRERQSLSEGH